MSLPDHFIIPKDEHLELHRVPNKKPDPPPPLLPKVVAVIISGAFAFYLIEVNPQLDTTISVPREISIETPSITDPTRSIILAEEQDNLPKINQDFSPSTQIPTRVPVSYNLVRLEISECDGVVIDGANFRQYPSLEALSIKGVIPRGQSVVLTGLTSYSDGLVWYEAINETILTPSVEPGAQNLMDSNQLGWIAECFV